jgi:hypothetical protein
VLTLTCCCAILLCLPATNNKNQQKGAPTTNGSKETTTDGKRPFAETQNKHDNESGWESGAKQVNSIKRHSAVPNKKRINEETQEYRNQLTDTGYYQSPEQIRAGLRSYTNKELFQRVKFIRSSAEMDFDQPIAKLVLKKRNVPNIDRSGFWMKHKRLIRESLRSRRNNVIGAMNRAFIGE